MTGGRYEGGPGLQAGLGADGVLRLVLDRPAKRNALDDAMVAALIHAVDSAGRDEAVRAVLLSGAGEHFCGGFDIVARNAGMAPAAPVQPGDAGSAGPDAGAAASAQTGAGAPDAALPTRDAAAPTLGEGAAGRRPRVGSMQRRLPSQAHRLIPLVASIQVPVVCAVRGWVAGIGLQLALAADFTFAARDAEFWEPFSERGFTPDSGATWLLPRRVGEVRARELLLLGRRLDAAEAVDWGLVHRAVDGPDLMAEAEALAGVLASGPTVALGLTKWLMHAAASSSLEEHLRNEAFALELSSRTEDFREGLTAFRDKRPPRFAGR